MSEKLKSRKLWAFIGIIVLVLANFIFKLAMPSEDVLYLVIAVSSYILGQGYVDAKQQKVDVFPSADLANSFTNIIQAELAKTGFGKNLPMEDILTFLKELGKLNITLTSALENDQTLPDSQAATGKTLSPQ